MFESNSELKQRYFINWRFWLCLPLLPPPSPPSSMFHLPFLPPPPPPTWDGSDGGSDLIAGCRISPPQLLIKDSVDGVAGSRGGVGTRVGRGGRVSRGKRRHEDKFLKVQSHGMRQDCRDAMLVTVWMMEGGALTCGYFTTFMTRRFI